MILPSSFSGFGGPGGNSQKTGGNRQILLKENARQGLTIAIVEIPCLISSYFLIICFLFRSSVMVLRCGMLNGSRRAPRVSVEAG